PRDVDVHRLSRERPVRERGRLDRGVEVEPVQGEEVVDDVELVGPAPVNPCDAAVLHDELGLGIVRTVECDEPELGPRRDEQLLAELARLARDEALRPARDFAHGRPEARAARRPRAPPARTPPCAAPRAFARAAPPTPPARRLWR